MFADLVPGVDLAEELLAEPRAEAQQDADADGKGPGRDASLTGMSAVLETSACLAYLPREAGAEVAAEVLTHGAYVSAVKLAEVLSKLAESGQDPGKGVPPDDGSGLGRGNA